MNVGGYAMIDCGGLNLLESDPQTIAGLFAKCKRAFESGKPMIATNCVYGSGFPVSPISVFAIYQGGEYCISASIIQVWVSESDSVRVVGLIQG